MCRKSNDHTVLGSSRRWLRREVEDDDAMKERKETMTIQRLNLETMWCFPHPEWYPDSLKELILPFKFASLQLREFSHQENTIQ